MLVSLYNFFATLGLFGLTVGIAIVILDALAACVCVAAIILGGCAVWCEMRTSGLPGRLRRLF